MERLQLLLKQRNLDFRNDDLRQADGQAGDGEVLGAWMEEYLSKDTLLSADELRLWQKLKQQKPASQTQSARPVTDDDLQQAIAALQSSTAAIEKQQRVLDNQRAALLALRTRSDTAPTGDGLAAHLQSILDSNHVVVAVENSQQGLREDFTAIGDHVSSTIRCIASYAAERLDSDDKSLDAITRLKLMVQSSQSTPDFKTVDQWCRALVTFRTEAVKLQIAKSYEDKLEQTTGGAETLAGRAEVNDKLQVLQAELETLRSEIASIVEIAADHEFRKPITTAVENSQAKRAQSQREWFDYISSSMRYITNRADSLGRHASDLHGFQTAYAEIKSVFAQLNYQVADKPVQSPKLERATSGLRPLLLTRSASGTIDTDDPVRLLRTLDPDIEVGKDGMTQARLEKILEAKLAKAEAQKVAAETSNLQVFEGYLQHERAETATVLGALYANTSFIAKSLSDRGMDVKVRGLENTIDRAALRISEVEAKQAEPLSSSAQKFAKRHGG